jgi:hypothetical protein
MRHAINVLTNMTTAIPYFPPPSHNFARFTPTNFCVTSSISGRFDTGPRCFEKCQVTVLSFLLTGFSRRGGFLQILYYP